MNCSEEKEETEQKEERLLNRFLRYGAIITPSLIELLHSTLEEHTTENMTLTETASWIINDDDTILWPSTSAIIMDNQHRARLLVDILDPPLPKNKDHTMTSTSLIDTPYFSATLPENGPLHRVKTGMPHIPFPDYLMGVCKDEQDIDDLYTSTYHDAIEAALACRVYLDNEVRLLIPVAKRCKNERDKAAFQKFIDHTNCASKTIAKLITDVLVFPVIMAAYYCDFDMVRRCMQCGFCVETHDSHGNSMLNIVCRSHNKPLEIMCMMSVIVTEGKASTNTLNAFGYAPIHFAIFNMYPEVISILLELGCNPSLRSDKPIPLTTECVAFTPMDIALFRWEVYQDEMAWDVMQMIWNTKYQRVNFPKCLDEYSEELQWGRSMFVSKFGYLPMENQTWSVSCGHSFLPIQFSLPSNRHTPPPSPLRHDDAIVISSLSPVKINVEKKEKKNIPTLRRCKSRENLRRTSPPVLRRRLSPIVKNKRYL